MVDLYGSFSHPVLPLAETSELSLFAEMDHYAADLRMHPKFTEDDLLLAFRQIQRKRRPELPDAEALQLFAVWRDHDAGPQAARAAAVPARLAALWAERDRLFEQRAKLPERERAAIDARIAAIADALAILVAPQRAPTVDLISK